MPKGTPPAIIERLSAEILKVVNLAATREAFLKQGFEPMPAGPAETVKLLSGEVAKWARPIADANVRLE